LILEENDMIQKKIKKNLNIHDNNNVNCNTGYCR